jgi:hypothetical protein
MVDDGWYLIFFVGIRWGLVWVCDHSG